VRRRSFLAAAGAPALAGCTGLQLRRRGSGETDAGPTPNRDPVPESDWERATPRPAWERAAEARIDEHRRSDVTVEVTHDGEPVRGADVELRLLEHAYDFSTAYNVARHRDSPEGSPYRRWVGRLFNDAVFENAHKWRQWASEGGHERTHGVIEFLRRNGVEVSGAPVVWQHDEQDVLPDAVWDALDAGDTDRLRSLIKAHVREIVGHNAAEHGVDEWVVLNEQLGEHVVTDALADAPPTESPPLREWFAIAREAAPAATLSINDYDILSLDRDDHRERYARLVVYLDGGEAPPDEVGFQSHFTGPGERVSAAEQRSRLDRFGALTDADLVVSEFDTVDFDAEEQAAEFLYRFLKVTYSHPETAGFRLWGYWDEQHWAGDAPLFRSDWSRKPGFHAYTDLVFDQWYTDAAGTTDADGTVGTTADLGSYALSVEVDGETVRERREVVSPAPTTLWVAL
jgi:GH35 family endo-1,4-beta-xylanase